MRRFLAFVLFLSLLPLKAQGTQVQYVALTFDDGPSGKYTRQLLDGLYDRGAKATFFLCGYRLKDYPDIAQRIFEEGHEIGCHGYSHKSMETMSRRDIADEILKTQSLLPQGCSPRFLRPPGGRIGDGLRQVAQVRNLAIVNWSVDSKDWATEDAAAVEAAVLQKVRDGDIVLLHDMSASSVQAALDIVDVLMEADFRLVTVSELVKIRNLRLKPGQEYKKFPPAE